MIVIGEIQKNKREKILICNDTYQGHRVCNLRVCFEVEPGKPIFTKKGLTVQISLLPDLVKILQAATEQEEAT